MNAKRFLVFVLFIFFSQQALGQGYISDSEHRALRDLYNTSGGINWVDTSDWHTTVLSSNGIYDTSGFIPFGISLGPTGNTAPYSATNPDLTVTAIQLPNNNLSGPLPSTFDTVFTQAIEINLANNSLSGNLPGLYTSVYSNNLKRLFLQNNDFSGTTPTALLNLSALEELDLSGNELTTIPTPPYNAPNLEYLRLNNNATLADNLPADMFEYFPNARVFDFSSCDLTGSLPALDTTTYYNCEELRLNNNPNLSNGIPAAYFANFPNVVVFDFSHCSLGGTLPALGSVVFSNCQELRLNDNGITGSISQEYFSNFPALKILDFSNNSHTGALPAVATYSFSNTIDSFNLSNNAIADTIHASILQLPSARSINLSNNNFESGALRGPNPSIDLASLEQLLLSQNQLDKPFPLQALATSAINLKELKLQDNQIRDMLGATPSNITHPVEVNVRINYLEFDDLSRIKQVLPTAGLAPAQFQYDNQQKATLGGVRRKAAGKPVFWQANVGEPVFNSDKPNVYQWYYSPDSTTTPFDSLGSSYYSSGTTIGTLLSSALNTTTTTLGSTLGVNIAPNDESPIAALPNISSGTHTGFYHVKVSNPDYPNLIIRSQTKKLRVGPCTDSLGQPVRCQEMLVQFEPSTSLNEKDSMRHDFGAQKIDSCLCGDIELWGLPDTMQVETFGRGTRTKASSARTYAKIESADPNYDLPTNTSTNSSNPSPPAGSNSSSPVIVAIIDSGVDYDHSDLENYVLRDGNDPYPDDGNDNDGNCLVDDHWGYNFLEDDNVPGDAHGHGTFVAGIVAGLSTPNVEATANPNIALLPIKYTDGDGKGTTFEAACGVRYAADQGAKVINASWGYEGEACLTLEKAIEYAGENCGALLVSSAGNASQDNDSIPHFPSNYALDNVISVAALDAGTAGLAGYSNYGSQSVDLAAQGTGINSTRPYGGLDLVKYTITGYDGTSFATAQVTRAAALLFQEYPSSSYRAVKDALLATVDSLGSADAAKLKTGGKLNLSAARTHISNNLYRASCDPVVNIRLKLEGAYDSTTTYMHNDLRTGGYLPTTQPFSGAPWNYSGTDTLSSSLLSVTGSDAIVDWVLLGWVNSLSAPENGTYQAAVVQRDGDVVDPNTGTPLSFASSRASYLLVMHQNHLAVRTLSPYELVYHPETIDLADTAGVATTYQKTIGGERVLAAGDSSQDGQVNAIDKNEDWRDERGTAADYDNTADYNLDGITDNADLNNVWLINNSLESGCSACYQP